MVVIAVGWGHAVAAAADPGDAAQEVVVVGEAPAPGDGPVQVEIVDVDGLPPSAELADAVARAPGAVVTRLGGVADYASVAIRGVGGRHVEVVFDGIPLNPEGGAAVDLSELPVHAFDRIEVVRGLAPPLTGSTALGGLVALVPADDRGIGLAVSGGSFGTGHATWTAGGPYGAGHLWAAVDALGTAGDFPYFDDGGTRSVATDDAVDRRVNNDTTRLTTVLRYAGPHVTVLHAGLWRDDGVPGFTFAPSPHVRYAIARQLVGARGDAAVGAVALGLRGYALGRVETLDDPAGEIGVGEGGSRDHTRSVGVDGTLRAALRPWLRVDGGLGGHVDGYSADGGSARTRVVGRAIAAADVAVDGIEAVPAVIAVVAVDPAADGPPTALVAPRIGFAAGAAAGWSVRANAGAVARPPDLTELYGDRGALVGNPDLRPEQGLVVDLGPAYRGPDAHAALTGFASRYRDLIAWTTGPQGVSRPENLARADVFGVELSAGLAPRALPLALAVSGALTRAVNRADDPAYAGNQLPRVPVAAGRAEISASPGSLGRATVDGAFTAGTWADTANLARQPPRATLGCGVALTPAPGWSLAIRLDNALDTFAWRVPRDPLVDDGAIVVQPVVDFAGQPLPGRAFTVQVAWAPHLSPAPGSAAAATKPAPRARPTPRRPDRRRRRPRARARQGR